jgi:uncharacterized protein YjbI with pentapeptide repeats
MLLLGVVIAFAVALGLWAVLGRPDPAASQSGSLTPTDIYDGIKIALTVVAGVGAGIVLVVVYRRQVYHEFENVRANATAAREEAKLYAERFRSAADQLGSDKAAVRLAGVYAMASLADDWHVGQQTCIDVLCGYLRMPFDLPTTVSRVKVRGQREEQQVRDTVVKLIGAHLRDAAAVSWQGRDFDFGGAVFDGCDFSGARFSGGSVSFSRATFTGEVIFAGAHFSDGGVYFSEAEFTSCDADFTWAQFNGGAVYFARTQFNGSKIRFMRAQVTAGDVYFGEARFKESGVYFGSTTFTGGEVSFTSASFADGSVVDFDQVRVAAGGRIRLGSAEFTGGDVIFDRADLAGGLVDFTWAKFAQGTVRFDGARFTGSEVDFTKANLDGGVIDVSHPSVYEVAPVFTWTTEPDGLRLPKESAAPQQRSPEPVAVTAQPPSKPK